MVMVALGASSIYYEDGEMRAVCFGWKLARLAGLVSN